MERTLKPHYLKNIHFELFKDCGRSCSIQHCPKRIAPNAICSFECWEDMLMCLSHRIKLDLEQYSFPWDLGISYQKLMTAYKDFCYQSMKQERDSKIGNDSMEKMLKPIIDDWYHYLCVDNRYTQKSNFNFEFWQKSFYNNFRYLNWEDVLKELASFAYKRLDSGEGWDKPSFEYIVVNAMCTKAGFAFEYWENVSEPCPFYSSDEWARAVENVLKPIADEYFIKLCRNCSDTTELIELSESFYKKEKVRIIYENERDEEQGLVD